MKNLCSCGSGEYKEAQYDGYGIFLCYTCDNCYSKKMKGFRSDIHSAYDCDEPIDEDYTPNLDVDNNLDLDQENPVDMSREAWQELYAKNPDLLDYDIGGSD